MHPNDDPSSTSTSTLSANLFSELDWENLITFIQEKQVLPIIGRELSFITDPGTGESILFETWLARQLAAKVGLEHQVSGGETLHQIVCAALQQGMKLPGLLATIKRLIAAHPFEVPRELSMLAEITDFPIFLTTAIDPLMEKALAKQRPVETFSYGPKRFDDLPRDFSSQPCALLYHLFGRPDRPSGGAVCEEDMVEWLTALQTPNHSPERLGSALENHHLLLIGLGFNGWLARFFMRAAKRHPLREDRDHQEYLADPAALADGDLVLFLQSMSKTTCLVEGDLSPGQFVRELHQRWQDANQGQAPSGSGTPASASSAKPLRFLPPEVEMPENAIFISYSRTDLEFAKRLKAACDARGINTWFDVDRLEAGDSYAAKIRANIDRCRYAIPIISASALARDEAFFYMEWDWMISRKRRMAPGAIFILPVISDATSPQHPKIPEVFSDLDIAVTGGDQIPESFLQRLESLTEGLAHA